MANSTSGGEEFLSTTEAVPPNILFVVDRSSGMADPCNSSSSDACFDTVLDVVNAMVQHYDWARYGLVTTSDDTHLTNGQHGKISELSHLVLHMRSLRLHYLLYQHIRLPIMILLKR